MIRNLPRTLVTLWLAGPLILPLGACGPATVGSLHPVTLQPGPREPSRVPEAEPDRLDPVADRETADRDSGTVSEGSQEKAGPPKRTVLSGSLSEEDEPTLMEIAERERDRRRDAPPPMVRIDDRNIERRASANATAEAEATREQAAEDPETESAQSRDELADAERYWRERVLSLRHQWQDLIDQERRLEARVNELRRDFYEEDDAYYRDAEIKPEWDQAWSELQQTRREVSLVVDELDRTIEAGRRDGALPGWLREGIELEPERPEERERESVGIAEPVEPEEVNRAREIDE